MPDDRAAFLRGAIAAAEELRHLAERAEIEDDATAGYVAEEARIAIKRYAAEIKTLPPPAAGPGWDLVDECEKALGKMIDAFVAYEGDVDCEAPPKHYAMMCEARSALAKIAAAREVK